MTNAFGRFSMRLYDGDWNVNVTMPSGRGLLRQSAPGQRRTHHGLPGTTGSQPGDHSLIPTGCRGPRLWRCDPDRPRRLDHGRGGAELCAIFPIAAERPKRKGASSRDQIP